jgi:peptidoglycan-associated lipoprotein
MKSLFKYLVVLAVVVGLAACSPKKNVKEMPTEEPTQKEVKKQAPEPMSEVVIEEEGTSNEIENVYFAFDKYDLDTDSIAVLERNARIIKANPRSLVRIEGNCDERGTIEYNLALGQKRANEVRDYYIRLGIPAKRITTVSYGEEKPVCFNSTEACWADNRRAETKLR